MDVQKKHNHSRMSEHLLDIFFKVESTHWWWMGRRRIIEKLLDTHLKKNKNVILDAGCGTGAEIIYLQKYGEVHGLDLSKMAVDYCKKQGIKNVKTGDVSKLPYKDKTYDLICLLDVLEHTSNDKLVLKEMYRVLKPGGMLMMTVPAWPFLYSTHDRDQGHFKRYVKEDLRQLLVKTKFQEIKTSYFNTFLSPPIVAIRMISKLGGPFAGLADHDSKLNYDVADISLINKTLTAIFAAEAPFVKNFDLPFGISLLTLYQKK